MQLSILLAVASCMAPAFAQPGGLTGTVEFTFEDGTEGSLSVPLNGQPTINGME